MLQDNLLIVDEIKALLEKYADNAGLNLVCSGDEKVSVIRVEQHQQYVATITVIPKSPESPNSLPITDNLRAVYAKHGVGSDLKIDHLNKSEIASLSVDIFKDLKKQVNELLDTVVEEVKLEIASE